MQKLEDTSYLTWNSKLGCPKPAFALLIAALFALSDIIEKTDYCARYNTLTTEGIQMLFLFHIKLRSAKPASDDATRGAALEILRVPERSID